MVTTPLPDVLDTCRVTIHYQYGGRNMVAVQHAHRIGLTGTMTNANATALATAVRNAWKLQFLPLQANGVTLNNVETQELKISGGAFGLATGADGGGDISSGNAPNSVAACVSWHTPSHYRGGHGRTYVGGLKVGTMGTTTSWTSLFQNSLNAAALAYLAAVNAAEGATWEFSIVHYHGHSLAAHGGNPWPEPITSATVNSRIDTQRRRLGK